MASSSNLALLTKSHKIIASKKKAKREQIKEVVFDEDARREFLTGFHKRKVQKQEAAKKKAIEREKQERLEVRREKRQMLAAKAAQNAADVEKAYGGDILKGSGDSEDEWSGMEDGGEREEEYEGEEQLATVTVVEDFDPEALLHGQNHPRSQANEDDVEDTSMEDIVHEPPSRPIRSSIPKQQPSKAAPKSKDPKKIKYQTNAARKADRVKQQKRKAEKAQRAGGKASRKRPGKR